MEGVRGVLSSFVLQPSSSSAFALRFCLFALFALLPFYLSVSHSSPGHGNVVPAGKCRPNSDSSTSRSCLRRVDAGDVGAAIGAPPRQFAVEQRHAVTVRPRPRGDEPLPEGRGRVGARVPVGHDPIDQRHLLTREFVAGRARPRRAGSDGTSGRPPRRCGVGRGASAVRCPRRGGSAVPSENPPKPTSAIHGSPSRSTCRNRCVRAGVTSRGCWYRTRADRGRTAKPMAWSTSSSSPFCSKQ